VSGPILDSGLAGRNERGGSIPSFLVVGWVEGGRAQSSDGASGTVSVGKTLVSFGLFSGECRIGKVTLPFNNHTRDQGCFHRVSRRS
jgi:hypothetical protein